MIILSFNPILRLWYYNHPVKRIIVITNSLTGGGAERSMNLVTNGLSKREFNVYLVPINAGPEDLVVNLAPVYSLNRRWRGGIAETVKAFIALQVFIRRIKPDALILNCDLPELFGALTLSRVKLIGVEHANFPWENRKQFGRVVRGILRRRKTIFTSTKNLANNNEPQCYYFKPSFYRHLQH